MKIIGIVSDLHGVVPMGVHDALKGCDYILCAGDCVNPFVLMELGTIAPTIAVRGNCDPVDIGPDVRNVAGPKIDGVRFKMVHKPEAVGSVPDDVDVLVCGHTHVPVYDQCDGYVYINPGSPTRPRGGSVPGVGRLVVDNGKVVSYERIQTA